MRWLAILAASVAAGSVAYAQPKPEEHPAQRAQLQQTALEEERAPNDLLRRCMEQDGLQPQQRDMLKEVGTTLGTVTERLQQILKTVRRDPTRPPLAPGPGSPRPPPLRLLPSDLP